MRNGSINGTVSKIVQVSANISEIRYVVVEFSKHGGNIVSGASRCASDLVYSQYKFMCCTGRSFFILAFANTLVLTG